MAQSEFTAEEILSICQGKVARGTVSAERGSICWDISLLRAGQWFLALPSTKSDGHDYLGEATARGALGCIALEGHSHTSAHPDTLVIAVSSTLHSLYMLASAARRAIDPKIIAITGSSGKSTTKDMCRAILSQNHRVYTTNQGSPDSRALAATLLSMPPNTEILIAELSQKGRGQIAWLSAGLKPDIAVITNVGLAHLETLGTLENIAAAKCEILEGVNRDTGLAILGDAGQTLVERASGVFSGGRCFIYNDTALEEVAVTPETTVISVSGSDVLFQLHAHGSGYLRDAWCAIACAREFGMSDAKIAEGLSQYNPPSGRGSRLIGAEGSLIIDESYSATPDSVRAAVTAFLDDRAVPQPRKFIVLSHMQELGEASDSVHGQLGTWLSDKNFAALLTVGQEAESILKGVRDPHFVTYRCLDANQAISVLRSNLGPNTAVLVDGSDSEQLREVISGLLAEQVKHI